MGVTSLPIQLLVWMDLVFPLEFISQRMYFGWLFHSSLFLVWIFGSTTILFTLDFWKLRVLVCAFILHKKTLSPQQEYHGISPRSHIFPQEAIFLSPKSRFFLQSSMTASSMSLYLSNLYFPVKVDVTFFYFLLLPSVNIGSSPSVNVGDWYLFATFSKCG